MEEQQNDRRELQEFFTWIDAATATGYNDPSSDQTVDFVPSSAIISYFEDLPRLRRILSAVFGSEDHNLDVELVRKDYPRVLCILLCINKGRYIRHFHRFESLCDRHLGWTEKPSQFPKSGSDTSFVNDFLREQWKFCAPKITPAVGTRELIKESIWPIIRKEPIASGVSADIYKILIHKDYDRLPRLLHEADQNRQARAFALKVYRGINARKHFETETLAYQRLKGHKLRVENIVQFYGGYIQDGKYFLILEYADSGSLEDVFQQIEKPSTGQEILDFWNEMFGITQALFTIHQILPEGSTELGGGFQGWHQDVRPSNILVTRSGSSSSFGYRFMLADLGLCHFKKFSTYQEASDVDSRGSRTYGAPECYRFNTSIAREPLHVKQKVDIWSLGCVFSEVAIWITGGLRGLRSYRQARSAETDQIEGFRDGDCFHNGETPLRCIEQYHLAASENMTVSDTLTTQVIDHMISYMLDERSEARLSAQQLWLKSDRLIGQARKMLLDRASKNSTKSSQPMTPPHVPLSDQRIGYRYSTALDHQELSNHGPTKDLSVTQRYSPPSSTYLQGHPSNPTGHPFVLSPSSSIPAITKDPEGSNQINDRLNGLALGPNSPNSYPMSILQTTPPPRGSQLEASPPETDFSLNRLASQEVDWDSSPSRNPMQGYSGKNVGLGLNTEQYNDREPNHRKSQHAQDKADANASMVGTKAITSSSPTSLPRLSVAGAIMWRDQKKSGRNPALPGDYLLSSLNQRDHVFLVDDSSSMDPHWNDVRTLIRILAYMTKDSDPDGLELYFTIKPDRLYNKHSTYFDNQLAIKRPHGRSDISMRLGSLLQDYMSKLAALTQPKSSWSFRKPRPVRPLNIYVLTDGIWQDRCDAKPPIRALVDKLEELRLPKQQVGITFIRFGNDPLGIARLKELDSGLGLGRDIVDHVASTGNIWKMLLGGINDSLDGEDE